MMIVGPCGAGKSVLARECGRVLDLPVYHLDAIHWKPGWIESDPAEFERRQNALVERESWIIDGTYARTIEARLSRADVVVLLDFSPHIYRRRVLQRIVRYVGRTRPDMGEGCREKLNLEFLRYVWRYHRDSRPALMRAIESGQHDARVIRLASPAEARGFVQWLKRHTSVER